MPIYHAVLALLAEGPAHGYELKSSFEEAIGPQWGDLNIGHLYQILDRLVRDGLVTGRVVPQSDRPDKRVFRLTGAGKREFERWLATPVVREGGYRDDFFLKLLAASRLGPDRVRHTTRIQREAYLGELAALGDLRLEHRSDPLIRLLIEAAIGHTEANLRIVELAERNAGKIAAASRTKGRPEASTPLPAKTKRQRRMA